MPKERKEETIKRIEEFISSCKIAIVTDYRGMPVAEMSQLRRRLRDSKTEYHVVKNTLASLAAERTGKEGLKGFLQGPSAIAFGYGEVTAPARVLVDYIRSSKAPLSIKGGLLEGKVLSPEEVIILFSLPSREVLISKVMGQMQVPISSLLAILSANLRGFVSVLQARKQQLEGG
ncbi:MAG TPA: 50S ribosomal protein L10 [Dehalococcoidia bacterium]|nr:50S ribosomal protein L10 [Dehalococcoidia bacterium]